MNLNQLFNFKYLLQNLKKSKGPLAVFIGFIPVLNVIIFLLMAQVTNTTGFIPTIEQLSIINFIGIYIIPIVLSIVLFNFIFKKKSVDFINSMPLNRTTIFITNTIGGIVILIAMILINMLFITLFGLIFPHVYIPFAMLIDYLIIWMVTYIFVFTAANIATSVSGNGITQLIVTALLLFLVPFVYDYTVLKSGNYGNYIDAQISCKNETCKPIQYLCYENTKCELDRSLNIYHTNLDIVKETSFTAPYGFPRDAVMVRGINGFNLYNGVQLIKMFILSIVYFIIGLILFRNRKMEVSETSFKNINVHNIIKCLTLIPIGFLVYEILNNSSDFISIIFVLVLILIYYFVYDLITRKSITQVGRGLIIFGIAAITILSYAGIVDNVSAQRQTNKFEISDIDSVAVMPSGHSDNKLTEIFVSNRELINLIVKNMLSTDGYWEYNKDAIYSSTDYTEPLFSSRRYEFNVILNSKGRQYTTNVMVDEASYTKIIEILSKDKDYVKAYKNLDYNNIYAVRINEFSSNEKESKEIINLVKDGMNKINLYDYFNSFNTNFMMVELFVYKNNHLETYKVSAAINKELHQKIINASNEQLKSAIIDKEYEFMNIWLENSYSLDLLDGEMEDKIYYILDNSQIETFGFINQHIDEVVDASKPYAVLSVNYNGMNHNFYTNNIEALSKFLNERLEYLKTTEDYNNIYNYKDYDEKYIQ